MPHGPANAVLVAAVAITHPSGSSAGGGTLKFSGWPESIRDMSGSGPCGPIFHGVWQSLQPMILTRYAPRVTRSADEVLVDDALNAAAARAARTSTPNQTRFIFFMSPNVVIPETFSC